MITFTGPSGKAAAVRERHAAQARLQQLGQQIADINVHDEDAESRRRELRLALSRVFDVLRSCDALLAPEPDPVLPTLAAIALDEPVARDKRMRLLLEALTDLPPSCREAGKVLRRALNAEVRGPSAGRVNNKQHRGKPCD